MITATYNNNRTVEVDHLINRGGWFSKTWLIEIGMGFESAFFVVEADYESCALDEFVDSKYGHLIKTDELCDACKIEDYDNCACDFAGNCAERIDTTNVSIHRCKVNYFAKREK